MNQIKLANLSDLDKLEQITKNCTDNLIENGIFQWNKDYPSREIIKQDIIQQQLWKLELNNIVIGLIILTEIEDDVYKNVKWSTSNSKNLYIHRLAVDPNFQGKGYARQMLTFAENYAKENKYDAIRLDTFSKNERNVRFYQLQNYTQLEAVYFPTQSEFPFYCFDKVIGS